MLMFIRTLSPRLTRIKAGSVYLTSSVPWCTSAYKWPLQFIWQKWPDCTAHQDVKVRTRQFCGLRSVHLEQ